MTAALNLSDGFLNADRQMEVVENFAGGLQANWTGAGTIAALNANGGGISLTTAATINTIASITLNAKPFIVALGKSITWACRLQYAEAATNLANILIGLHSGAVASAMGDNGAGTPASYTGFAFFKKAGDTLWSVESCVGSAKTTTQLSAGSQGGLNKVARTAGGANYVIFGIDVLPKDSTKADIIYTMDGVCVAKHTDFVYTGAVAMAPLAHVKAGSGVAQAASINLMKFAGIV